MLMGCCNHYLASCLNSDHLKRQIALSIDTSLKKIKALIGPPLRSIGVNNLFDSTLEDLENIW